MSNSRFTYPPSASSRVRPQARLARPESSSVTARMATADVSDAVRHQAAYGARLNRATDRNANAVRHQTANRALPISGHNLSDSSSARADSSASVRITRRPCESVSSTQALDNTRLSRRTPSQLSLREPTLSTALDPCGNTTNSRLTRFTRKLMPTTASIASSAAPQATADYSDPEPPTSRLVRSVQSQGSQHCLAGAVNHSAPTDSTPEYVAE